MRIAVIGAGSKRGEEGGAERFYEGVTSALSSSDVKVDLICPISDESNFEAIKKTYLHFYDLNLSNYDGVISTKAPAYITRHPNHICYLQHTMRVFYDMFDFEFPYPTRNLLKQRDFIRELDTLALQYPRTRKVFTIGNEVKKRLIEYNGIDSEVIYQDLLYNNFRNGAYKYIFMPGRLHRWKRVDLVIKAMKYTTVPVKLLIAGIGEDAVALRHLARGDNRIDFLGKVSDERLVELYSNALCVPFVPIREDFGLVTLEAFRSEKPVITCADSGEPAHLVKDGESGFVCPPSPKEIAKRINHLCENQELARAMGKKGKLSIEYINWPNVAVRLLSALRQ